MRRADEVPMTIEPATERELAAVRELLERHGLPLDGVDATLRTMIVARLDNRVVGTAALELYGEGALLRSVVVDAAHRGLQLGHQLTEAAIALARTSGVSAVIRPDGTIVQKTEMFTPDALVDEVPLRSSLTPATRLGTLPEGILALLAVAGLGWVAVRSVQARKDRRQEPESVPSAT